MQATEPSGAPASETPAAAETRAPSSNPSPPPSSTPPAPPSPAPPSSPSSTLTCDDETVSGVQTTILGQQDAFARGDYAAARAFASQTFQATVTEEQFASIIADSYAFLLDDPPVKILQCATAGDRAQVIVSVTGPQVVEMSYLLVREESGWRIDAASALSTQNGMAA
jgi:hypothetical protein